MRSGDFPSCDMTEPVWRRRSLMLRGREDADSSDAQLTDAQLTDAQLTDAPLTDAPLTDAQLT